MVAGIVAGTVVGGDAVKEEQPLSKHCGRPRSRWWDGGFVVGLSGGGSFGEGKGDGDLYGRVLKLWWSKWRWRKKMMVGS